MAQLCLGTVQFGMNYGVQENGQPSLSKALEILNTAYAAGIRNYDTAASYGSAEAVLNVFLSQSSVKPENVRIISKTKSADERMKLDVEQTLRNLGLSYLNGCLLHDANLIFNERAVNNLKSLKDNGVSKEIGISVYTPEQAVKSLDYDFIDIIQVPYNVLDRRLDKCNFFENAKKSGMTVYVRSVLLQGLLMINADELPDHMKFAEPYVRKFQDICNKNEIGYFEGAVGYVLNHEDIDFLVFGVDNLNQLNDYISLYNDSKILDYRSIFSSVFENVDEKVIMPTLWNER